MARQSPRRARAALPEEKRDFLALERGLAQLQAPLLLLARREQVLELPGWREMPVQSLLEVQAQAPQRRHCSLPNRLHRVPLSVS